MITKEEAQKLKALIENLLVYTEQSATAAVYLKTESQDISKSLWEYSYERSSLNAETCGKDLVSYIDRLTEGDWVEWSGGNCPVALEDKVQYKTSLGKVHEGLACNIRWQHIAHMSLGAGDVIAYRVLS